MFLLVALNAIADLEVLPGLKRDTTLGVLPHGFNVFLHVLERVDDAW